MHFIVGTGIGLWYCLRVVGGSAPGPDKGTRRRRDNHMEKINYAGVDIDPNGLPATSLTALLRRGIVHFLGNEQAAKVSGWKAKFEKDNGREPNDDEVDAARQGFVAKAVEALNAGTIGQSVRGPSVSALDSIKETIARGKVLAILKAAGIKPPKKDEAVRFADGQTKTMEEMIDTWSTKNAEALDKQANEVLAERKAKAKAAAEAAKAVAAEAGDKSAEALGL